MKYKNFGTLEQVEEGYLRENIERIDDYIASIFELMADDGDLNATLSQLRTVVKVKGIGETAKLAGLSRQGLQKALSPNGNPTIRTFIKVLGTFGYQLTVEPISDSEKTLLKFGKVISEMTKSESEESASESVI